MEVNGATGNIIVILRGCGQGNPLSSVFFLVATEALNRALVLHNNDIKFKHRGTIAADPLIYADDIENLLSLPNGRALQPLVDTYAAYHRVSGLEINMAKTEVLLINSPAQLQQELMEMGIVNFTTTESPCHISPH